MKTRYVYITECREVQTKNGRILGFIRHNLLRTYSVDHTGWSSGRMIRYIGMGNMYSSLLFSLPPREAFTTHDHLLVSRGDAAGPNGTSECVERLLGRIDAPGSKGGIKATRQQSCVVRSSCSVACWKFSTRTCAYLFLLAYRGLTCSRFAYAP